MHKVYDPTKFVPGSSNVQIVEDDKVNNKVIRRMTMANPKGEFTILEEITWDEPSHLITFKLLEHPTHTGEVINRVDILGENDYVLYYKMDWTFKGQGDDPLALAGMAIKPAVIKSV